jgi:DNA-binding NtrC family response regulator
VRELQNCVERAVILCDGPEIEPQHLRIGGGDASGPRLEDVIDLRGTLDEVGERAASRAQEEAVRLALADTGGDRAAAAARLGISAAALGRRVKAQEHPSS